MDTSARRWQRKLWDAALGYKGLYNARANGARPASVIYARLPEVSPMHYYGHGLDGGGAVTTSGNMLFAQRPTLGEAYGGTFLSDLAANALSRTLLVVWQACRTAVTSTDAHGNLMEVVIAKGAKTSPGFKSNTRCIGDSSLADIPRDWSTAFWRALCQGVEEMTDVANGQPQRVLDAAKYALLQVEVLNQGKPYGLDTLRDRR